MKALIVIAFTLYAAISVAGDSIVECVDRGRLALDIAKEIASGTAPENINFAFPNATPATLASAEAWGEQLKTEIVAGLKIDSNPETVARKIMELCAYNYGKDHSLRKGSENSTFIRIASNEEFSKQRERNQKRYDECSELLKDHVFIGNMLGSGRSAPDELRALATKSVSRLGLEEAKKLDRESDTELVRKLGQDRLKKILQLIDVAEVEHKNGTLQAWFNSYWNACYDGTS